MFQGLSRWHVRSKIEEDLKNLNLFVDKKDHNMHLPVCSRSGDVIEPQLRSQWFVDCRQMAAQALDAVRTGELQLIPAARATQWERWLGETDKQDWCVSRQLWWGHRIPAYLITFTSACKVRHQCCSQQHVRLM